MLRVLISIYVLLGKVCAPLPVQAYSAIASRVSTKANCCELLLSLSREPHANLSYIRLTYVMDLNILHAILLPHLQVLLLYPASEVRSVMTSHLLLPPLQPPPGRVCGWSELICPLNMQ